jgi:hypothetical protein
MWRKSLLWCVLVVSSLGCSAESGPESEELGQGNAAIEVERGPTPTCTVTGEFRRSCRDHGGASTCDDTTAMCCKTTRDENGNPSTFCSSNPDEVRPGLPNPSPTVAPIEPALGTVR